MSKQIAIITSNDADWDVNSMGVVCVHEFSPNTNEKDQAIEIIQRVYGSNVKVIDGDKINEYSDEELEEELEDAFVLICFGNRIEDILDAFDLNYYCELDVGFCFTVRPPYHKSSVVAFAISYVPVK